MKNVFLWLFKIWEVFIINIIVNVTKDWGIGVSGDQPFYIKEDLRFFKTTTLNKTVVMGRKTLMALPNKKPLGNRNNIVLSTSPLDTFGITQFYSLEECLEYLRNIEGDNIYIIGGGSIYSQFLDYTKTAYVTKIYKSTKTTVQFPNLDNILNWTLVKRSSVKYENGLHFSFCEYKNNSPKKY